MRSAPRCGGLVTFLGAGWVLMGLVGCWASHRCGEAESCNYADDDCDGRIDEDFRDEAGRYLSPEHCGGCGVACSAEMPTAAETACRLDAEGEARCVLVACPEGWHQVSETACAPDVPVLCLPCEDEEACTARNPGSACVEVARGDPRCLPVCLTHADCALGWSCIMPPGEADVAVCWPPGGSCDCRPETVGAVLACTVVGPDGGRCAGGQRCTETGLDACEPVLEERCNGADDDCDGASDEDFRDDAGRYIHPLHCGGCDRPCVAPGPNMVAECLAGDAGVRCEVRCEEGFVDVNGLQVDGCECRRFDGTGPPPVVGGDADCDGVPDDDADFVYVTSRGSDRNPGTRARPMRSIGAAIARARRGGKDVLVAQGNYDEHVVLVPGVSVFGGYRDDFRDRDPERFPVVLERAGAPGEPVVSCRGILRATRLEGVTVRGSVPVRAGEGSTAVYLDGCGPAVVLASVTVLAAEGTDGRRGGDSSEHVAEVGVSSLAELDGVDGRSGEAATERCMRISGGGGGVQRCGGRNVSGGRGGDSACPALGCFVGRPCGNAGCTDFMRGGLCDLDAALAVAVPNPAAADGRGPGGGRAGEPTYDAPTNRGVCHFCDDNPSLPRLGQDGSDGRDGSDGLGGRACAAGRGFDAISGRLRGEDGADGQAGTDGGGGGGGSPGAGFAVIGGTEPGCESRPGGAGGGGGSGGCGAPRSGGGQGGGASVGIAVRLPASGRGPTFRAVRVVTAHGGDGGDGGIGAAGGRGGVGAAGGAAVFWCARRGGRGGDGGRGGSAGGGGGGCGGDSVGLLLVGHPEADYRTEIERELVVDAVGRAGRAGRGGFSPVNPGGDATPGQRRAVMVLTP